MARACIPVTDRIIKGKIAMTPKKIAPARVILCIILPK